MMKFRNVLILILLSGCVSNNLLQITGFEEVIFMKRVDILGNYFNLYELRNETSYKTVKEFVMNKEEIDEYVVFWEQSIAGVFNPSPAPYPGTVTRKIECPEYFLPIRTNGSGNHIFSYEIFTNPRGIIGVCSEDLVGYYCLFSFLKCDEQLYELEYCVQSSGEKHDFAEFKNKINC
jgi:hypothetical protein